MTLSPKLAEILDRVADHRPDPLAPFRDDETKYGRDRAGLYTRLVAAHESLADEVEYLEQLAADLRDEDEDNMLRADPDKIAQLLDATARKISTDVGVVQDVRDSLQEVLF